VKTPPRRLLRAQPAGTLRSLSSSSSSSTFSSSSSSPRRGGGIFIGLGWTLLGLVALDQALQYRQEQEAKEHMRVLVVMQQEANEQNQAEWDTSLPTLFQCKIVHTEHSLDGTKMLRNIKVGDVVEVMEEDLGPNKAYHLCRFVPSSLSNNNREKGSIGWYPSEYMEKLETI
jgi:hypothetical protein